MSDPWAIPLRRVGAIIPEYQPPAAVVGTVNPDTGLPRELDGWTLAEVGAQIRRFDDDLLLTRAQLAAAQGTTWGFLLNIEIARRAFGTEEEK